MKKINKFKALTKEQSPVMYVRYLPDVFLVFSLGAILFNDLSNKFFGLSMFNSSSVFSALAAPITISVVLLLVRILKEIREDILPLHRLASDSVEVCPGEGAVPYSDLMQSRSQIDVLTLSGSVIIPLDKEQVVNSLLDPRRLSRVRCLMANPLSPAIIGRYAKDEPIWKEAGVEAIEKRLIWLFNLRERNGFTAREKLQLRVYNSYPMISIFRADDSIYASYYAYKLRGHDTPMFRTDISSYLGRSVMLHFEKLYADSISLNRWMEDSFNNIKSPDQVHFGLRYSGIFLETNEKKLVFQKRDNKTDIANPNQLSVFGGRSLENESSISTAIRELKEETTLRAKEEDLIHIAVIPYVIKEEEEERCLLCNYFLLRNVESSTIKQKEGAAFEILSLGQALERYDLTEVPRRILKEHESSGDWPRPNARYCNT